jgi:hypothetical protein
VVRFGHIHRYCQMQINQDLRRLHRHRKVIISMPQCRSFHRIQHIIISVLYIKIITTMRITTLMLACMREISIMIRIYNLLARRTRNLRFPLALTGKIMHIYTHMHVCLNDDKQVVVNGSSQLKELLFNSRRTTERHQQQHKK